MSVTVTVAPLNVPNLSHTPYFVNMLYARVGINFLKIYHEKLHD